MSETMNAVEEVILLLCRIIIGTDESTRHAAGHNHPDSRPFTQGSCLLQAALLNGTGLSQDTEMSMNRICEHYVLEGQHSNLWNGSPAQVAELSNPPHVPTKDTNPSFLS